MGVKSFFQKKLISWLLPSNLIEWLKGKKTITGALTLLLWFLIYGLPFVCTQSLCGQVAEYSLQLQQLLESLGVELDVGLLKTGAGLTVVGLLDKVFKHWLSDLIAAAAKKLKL